MAGNTYEILGDRAPVPCDIGDAHGVAQAALQKGLNLTPLPFRQPELLDDEIRIRTTHAGLCHTDVFFADGSWGDMAFYPLVPGHQIVGVVEKLGEKVTKFQVGDRVGFGTMRDCCDNCYLCAKGDENMCPDRKMTYAPHFGGYATSFQARAKFFFKMPDNLPGEFSPMFCAGITTYSPLYRDVTSNMKVGIAGIGGLGHLGIKFARAMGCEVTAFSTSANKEQEARNLGAHHFVNISDPEEVKKAANSVDVFMTTATKYNMSQDASYIRPHGFYIPLGVPPIEHDVGFHLFPFLFKNVQIRPSLTGSIRETEAMIEFASLHNLVPITEVYPFGDTQRAYDSLAHGTPHYPHFRAVVETASFFQTFTPAN